MRASQLQVYRPFPARVGAARTMSRGDTARVCDTLHVHFYLTATARLHAVCTPPWSSHGGRHVFRREVDVTPSYVLPRMVQTTPLPEHKDSCHINKLKADRRSGNSLHDLPQDFLIPRQIAEALCPDRRDTCDSRHSGDELEKGKAIKVATTLAVNSAGGIYRRRYSRRRAKPAPEKGPENLLLQWVLCSSEAFVSSELRTDAQRLTRVQACTCANLRSQMMPCLFFVASSAVSDTVD
ncbi:hypothetical protein Bbelb_015670 [Branchiostoma belcheri]|nr:hypothetical protein Bbelb_015670 [Branchiostoma belcheri]